MRKGERIRHTVNGCGDWVIEVDRDGEIVNVRSGAWLRLLVPTYGGAPGDRQRPLLGYGPRPGRGAIALRDWQRYGADAAVGIEWICRCGAPAGQALPSADVGRNREGERLSGVRVRRRPVIHPPSRTAR